jgi:hypothetical protein
LLGPIGESKQLARATRIETIALENTSPRRTLIS